MREYKIIGTGSSGNCVRVDDVMFDCGMPYQKIEPELKKVSYLLITHKHCDHVIPEVLARIHAEHPEIITVGNDEVKNAWSDLIDVVAKDGQRVPGIDDIVVVPYDVPHSVQVTAYTIWDRDAEHVLYTTDCYDLPALDSQRFDRFFLESNHAEEQVERLASVSAQYGYNVRDGMTRHLSNEYAARFYFNHRTNKRAPWIRLHMSSRFY